MLNRRWWDAAVAGGATAIALGLVFGFGPSGATGLWAALACVLAFVVAYLLIARPGIGADSVGRFAAFLATAAAIVAVGAAFSPFLAMLQVLAYPLVWVLGDSRRRGIGGSAVIALAVFLGYAIGGGFTIDALVAGAATAVFSFAFAAAFGLWIASIAEYGEERARLLAELEAAQSQVEALSRDRGVVEERERMAREIHDTLAQTLAGMVLLSERAARQFDAGSTDAAAASIATLEGVAREALAEARALVSRAAAVPSDAAFAAAVERLVERFRTETGMTIELEVEETGGAGLGREAQVVVLRCLQETLANARKHAGASLVRVAVEVTDAGAAVVTVRDDGRGFDPLAARSGFGLDGMSERVAIAGGELELESAPGRGTAVVLRLPAPDPAPAKPYVEAGS